MRIYRVLAFTLLSVCLRAQNWTAVSASNITDLNQQKLAAGSLCLLGTDQNDVPISFGVGGGGQVLARPFCVTVTNGAAAALTVPNPQNTQPPGIYYRVSVTDSATGQVVLRYRQVAFTGGAFNLDNYTPTSLGSFIPISGNAVNGNLSVNGGASITGGASAASLSMASSTASPKLTVGSLGVNNSVDSQVLISRAVDDSVSGNAHGYSDSSTVSRSGSIGYAAYDARGQHSGSNSFDHLAAFQNGWIFGGSGTMTNLYGLVDVPGINSGTVTNRYGVKINDVTGLGTVTNNYGIDVASLTRSSGANGNYAIVTEGATRSKFGGDIRGHRFTCAMSTVASNSNISPAPSGSGWGSGAAVASVVGTDCGAFVSITAGASPTANPTLTFNFADGNWTNESGNITPIVVAMRQDANAPASATWTLVAGPDHVTFTFNGTPVSATTYALEFAVLGR